MLNINGAKMAIKIANMNIIGVYIFPAFATNVSLFVFLSVASSTNSSILATVESSNRLVTLISITFSILIEPDKTLLFSFTSTNSLSPVNADSSNFVCPFIIMPSTGILSPFFTIKISSIFISSMSTFETP